MIPKDVDQITEADLKELIENFVAERKTIEYKRELPGKKDSDKKEFLADVSSFTNASGGDIVYGMDEENGLPKELTGLALDVGGVEREILRVEQLMASGIRPRIVGHKMREILLSNNKVALIVRVPKSWQSPHRVIFGGHDKFYGRNAKGKYPLDVDELRVAFNLSETISERIRSFRADRIAKILADEGPISLEPYAKIVLHVMPVGSFGRPQSYNIRKYYEEYKKINLLLKLNAFTSSGRRYNFNGILAYCMPRGGKCWSYVQLFKNGVVEAVDTYYIMERDGKKCVPSQYENRVVKGLENYLSLLKDLGVDMPAVVSLTLAGVQGYAMDKRYQPVHVQHRVVEPQRIVENILLVPEVEVRSYEEKAVDILKGSFDAVWNAGGLEGSPNYDHDGKWIGNGKGKKNA